MSSCAECHGMAGKDYDDHITDNCPLLKMTPPPQPNESREEPRTIDVISDLLREMVRENQPYINIAIAINDHYERLINHHVQAGIEGFAEKLRAQFPRMQDEYPVDLETGAAVETYGYEATHNQAVRQCCEALDHLLQEERKA